jgi:hypothetical protein
MTVNCWRVRGPSRHRYGYRHREKGLGKRFSRYRDGHDAHDGPLRAYSREGGASLLPRPYPFNLTRRTRRTEQGAPYLCGFPTYDWRRVCLIALITRRCYPTRGWSIVGLVVSIVGSAPRTRRLQTPYLCWIPRLSSGSSGFVSY